MDLCCRDRGQAVPAVVLVFLVLAVALLLLTRLAGVTTDRAQARTAADAAALVAVVDTDEAARAMAERNGARLVHVSRSGGAVEVVVEVGEARASARARFELSAPARAG